jgi:Leucine-rich repeat (LRR) protein
MKKLYFVLIGFLVFGSVNAQIINIPDANFKVKLLSASASNVIAKDLNGNYFKIDSNNDGNIQVSEALQVSYLNVSNTSNSISNISDVTGIEYFINLYYLDCSFNFLISSINVNGLSNLQYLDCDFNQLSSLDVIGLTNLNQLDCNYNQLSSLDVSGLTNLSILRCSFNQLSSLNLSGLNNITYLDCNFNQLPSINVSGLTNLYFLFCSSNLLPSLNVNGLINLQNLHCDNNLISSLNLTGLNNITDLDCSHCNLTTLDLSNQINLQYLHCQLNNSLTSLFIKNSSTQYLDISGNPNLHYICADASEIVPVQNLITQYGYACTVDSSCALSTNEFQNQTAFSIYRNPAKDNLILEYNIEQNIQSISIYNTLGQVMLVTSNPSKIIDVSNLNTGSYFIKVITDKGTSSGKFMKE